MTETLTLKFNSPGPFFLNQIQDPTLLEQLQSQGQLKIEKRELSEEERYFSEESPIFHIAIVETQRPLEPLQSIGIAIQDKDIVQFACECLQYFAKSDDPQISNILKEFQQKNTDP